MVLTSPKSTIVRVDGKLVRKPSTSVEQQRFESLIRKKEDIQRTQQLQNQASQLDKTFVSSNFFNSKQEFKKQLESIPPEIRRFMKINESVIDSELNKRKDRVKTIIEAVDRRITSFDEQGDKISESAERSRRQGLQEGLGRLEKGELLETEAILEFARGLRKGRRGRLEFKQEQQQELKIQQQQKALQVKVKARATLSEKIQEIQGLRKRLSRITTAPQIIIKKDEADEKTLIEQFKQEVNNELGRNFESKLKTSDSVSKFQQALGNLEQKKKDFATPLLKQTKNQITRNLISVENKALTGQSLTPKDQQQLLLGISQSRKDLTTQQVNNLKTVLRSPVTYGENLKVRINRGEKNPIFNDVVNIGKGVGLGLKEVFFDPVVGAFEYGIELRKRFEKGENNPFINDIKKVTRIVKDVSSFAKNNKVASALIVAGAVVSGLKLTKAEFKKKPAESLGRSIAWLFPERIVAGASKIGLITGRTTVRALKSSSKLIGDLSKRISKIDLKKVNVKSFENIKKQSDKLKTNVEVLTGKEAEVIKNRFNKFESQLNDLNKKISERKIITIPTNEKQLLTLVRKDLALPKKEILLIVKRFDKISPRFQLTTTVTKNKGLFKIGVDKKLKVKVTPTLSRDRRVLIDSLQQARQQSGEAFSKLKVKIKKETGFNVVVTPTNKKLLVVKGDKIKEIQAVKIDLKKPIEPKGKPKKKEKVAKRKKIEIDIISRQELKRAKKDSQQIELLLDNGLIKEVVDKTVTFNKRFGKKGAARLNISIKKGLNKFFKKSNRDGSRLTRESTQHKKSLGNKRRDINSFKKSITKDVDKLNKLNRDIRNLNKSINNNDRNRNAIERFIKKLQARRDLASKKGNIQEVKSLQSKINSNNTKLIKENKRASQLSNKVQSQFKQSKSIESKLRTKLNNLRKDIKTFLSTQSKKIKTQLKVLLSKLSKQRIELNNLSRLGISLIVITKVISGIESMIKNLSGQLKDIDQLEDTLSIPKIDLELAPQPVTPSKITAPSKPAKPRIKVPTKITPKIKVPVKPKPPTVARPRPISKPPIKPEPKKFKLPDLKLSTKLPRGVRLSFGIKFRERRNPNKSTSKSNPVVVKSINFKLPFNKAVKKGFGAVDTTLQRSGELFITGLTKAKDISKQDIIMKKFRIRKGEKALQFVEKSKFTIDTRGEKRGLSLSRKLKIKTKKPKINKKRN